MPAIVSHHLFGEDAYAALSPVIGQSAVQRDAFLLGNQGPDPLFLLKALPASISWRAIGTMMHSAAPAALLDALHRSFIARPRKQDNRPQTEAQNARVQARRAYALGFLCHYLLDSTAHPLVYAQQIALANANQNGLGLTGREVHALIETEIDEYLLTTRRKTTMESYSPHREILSCPGDALVALSTGFPPVAKAAYDLDIPALAFASAVKLYRAAQAAIDSKREGLRRHVDYARLAGKAYTHIQALTHESTPNADCPFANDEHVPWPHPFEKGKTVSASFEELYDATLTRALSLVPQFARDDFSIDDCEELTCGINFYGQPT